MAVIELFKQPAHRHAASFGAADLAWEQVQGGAVRAYRAGRVDSALLHWRRGLTIARTKFGSSDPRLGTSLVNVGFAQRRSGEVAFAQKHFFEAEEVFARDWRWIGRMQPPGGPEAGYDQRALGCFRQLARDLHRRAEDIRVSDELPSGRLERWRLERPAARSDLRKLLGASLLLVSRPSG